jgi:hypothetical protein
MGVRPCAACQGSIEESNKASLVANLYSNFTIILANKVETANLCNCHAFRVFRKIGHRCILVRHAMSKVSMTLPLVENGHTRGCEIPCRRLLRYLLPFMQMAGGQNANRPRRLRNPQRRLQLMTSSRMLRSHQALGDGLRILVGTLGERADGLQGLSMMLVYYGRNSSGVFLKRCDRSKAAVSNSLRGTHSLRRPGSSRCSVNLSMTTAVSI